ncbi:MAG: GNAT family N-acetyltransferase [Candidatus Hodarchaeales archaeon]|jgi:GNAT superfamily N-acetyltransferase
MAQFLKLKEIDNISNFQFSSGIEQLDNFLFNDSIDFIKEGYSQVYYLREKDKKIIIGFFAISCGNLEFRKSLRVKRIRFIPSILIGQLAISSNYRRRGFGGDLVKKAMKISLRVGERVGCRMVIVDARTNLEILKFYKDLKFKYLKKDQGQKIERALYSKHEPSVSTIKMYFDLKLIRSS